MRIRPLHKFLLAAVLVFGQWLAIAHDYQHPATGSDPICQVCVHGPGFQAGPPALPVLGNHWLAVETPLSGQPAQALSRRHSHAPIRAPPTRLV